MFGQIKKKKYDNLTSVAPTGYSIGDMGGALPTDPSLGTSFGTPIGSTTLDSSKAIGTSFTKQVVKPIADTVEPTPTPTPTPIRILPPAPIDNQPEKFTPLPKEDLKETIEPNSSPVNSGGVSAPNSPTPTGVGGSGGGGGSGSSVAKPKPKKQSYWIWLIIIVIIIGYIIYKRK